MYQNLQRNFKFITILTWETESPSFYEQIMNKYL